MATEDTEELVATKLMLPQDVKLYLQHRAVDERSNVTRIVVEIIRREMARDQR